MAWIVPTNRMTALANLRDQNATIRELRVKTKIVETKNRKRIDWLEAKDFQIYQRNIHNRYGRKRSWKRLEAGTSGYPVAKAERAYKDAKVTDRQTDRVKLIRVFTIW